MKPGTFAPHCDAPNEETTRGSTSIAAAAESVATMSAGKELEAPTATASPFPTPASRRSDTARAAKSGFVVVRLASSCPEEVVISEPSTPMSPVPLGSTARSRAMPRAARHSRRAAVARAISREASIISARAAGAGPGRTLRRAR
ncbi:MAG: hypothetical protein MZV64_64070 [Ignavibacteriales bacterium]|nr:hypothetical protein [Ignavibacteriales bacterium]